MGLGEVLLEKFADEDGGFFFTAKDHESGLQDVVRSALLDIAVPSGPASGGVETPAAVVDRLLTEFPGDPELTAARVSYARLHRSGLEVARALTELELADDGHRAVGVGVASQALRTALLSSGLAQASARPKPSA